MIRFRSIYVFLFFLMFGIFGIFCFNNGFEITEKQIIYAIISMIGIFFSMLLLSYDVIKCLDKKIKYLKNLTLETQKLLDLTIEKSVILNEEIDIKKDQINELVKNNKNISIAISKEISKLYQ